MASVFTGRSFLKLLDYSTEEIRELLDLSKRLKAEKKAGKDQRCFVGKNIVLLFEKTSTRTRCSFEVAGRDLGLGVTYLDPGSSQMGKKESIEDTAKVLGRLYDGIEYRGYAQKTVETLAEASGVPVWNGLTDDFHPTQMLADLLTIEEHFGKLEGLNFCFMGDCRNNVARSLMVACVKMGLNFSACGPRELWPDQELIDVCTEIAKQNSCKLKLTDDPVEGSRGQDIIYTDIWVSMGEDESIWADRIKQLKPYQVNSEMMARASDSAIFLHCLPSFHDRLTTVGEAIHERFGLTEMEVSDEVFRSPASLVFDEAENRMHTIKAVIYASLGGCDLA
ncbi:MAG: ornithine carbamoyltransferase [Eubacteriales bacterium]|nr:ornithine carbamoyltransferase [Eubacteriales bacterium]